MSVKEQKGRARSHAADEVNPVKSRLMDIQSGLAKAGCFREAEGLDRIIARLEDWQARMKR